MNATEALEWMRANPYQIIDSDYPDRAWWRLDNGPIYCGCNFEDCDCCEGDSDTDEEFLRYVDASTRFTPRVGQ